MTHNLALDFVLEFTEFQLENSSKSCIRLRQKKMPVSDEEGKRSFSSRIGTRKIQNPRGIRFLGKFSPGLRANYACEGSG